MAHPSWEMTRIPSLCQLRALLKRCLFWSMSSDNEKKNIENRNKITKKWFIVNTQNLDFQESNQELSQKKR